MTFSILLTCVGGELAPQMITTLKASSRFDVRVIGVDSQDDAVGRHFADAFYKVPYGNSSEYIDVIEDIVSKNNVDLVLPTSDEEALSISHARERLEALGCIVACTDFETLELLSNKIRCYEHLEGLGIAQPKWKSVSTFEALSDAVYEFEQSDSDFVVKPAVARGGRGIRVVTSSVNGAQPHEGGREIHMDRKTFRETYMAEFAEMMPAIVMERLVDPVHDLDMLGWKGDPLRVVPRRRVSSALPNEGHIIVDNPDLIALGEALITGLNLSWLYDCDVMMDTNGRPAILEINPRQSGSVAATIAAGVPLLEDVIALAKGEALQPIDVPFGKVVVPYKTFKVCS